jgi:hypothetical protein
MLFRRDLEVSIAAHRIDLDLARPVKREHHVEGFGYGGRAGKQPVITQDHDVVVPEMFLHSLTLLQVHCRSFVGVVSDLAVKIKGL